MGKIKELVSDMMDQKYALYKNDSPKNRTDFVNSLDLWMEPLYDMWRVVFEDDSDMLSRLDIKEAKFFIEDSLDAYNEDPSRATLVEIAIFAADQIKKLKKDVKQMWLDSYLHIDGFDILLESSQKTDSIEVH